MKDCKKGNVMDCVQKNKEIFEKAFQEYGDDTRSCLWDKPMIMRYQELKRVAELENCKVLDIGCGLGGLYEYLVKDCGITGLDYTGVDIVDGMIETATKKYPEARFMVKDLLKEKLQETYDYVFLCGVFNVEMSTEFMKQMLKQAFSYCEKGLAFNFISDYVNFKTDGFSYHNPQEIFTFCVENLSRKIDMHHHYAKCDVSMFVYR